MASPSPQSPSPPGTTALGRMAAQLQIEFELEFFAGILDRRPDFIETLKAHAKNLAQARRHQEGLQIDRQLARLMPTDSLARYNLACSLAVTQQLDEAIAELRHAVELGYRDFAFIKQDRDLDSIRKDPRFRALLREYDRNR